MSVGGERPSHAQRAVPGEGADLQHGPGPGETDEQGEELAFLRHHLHGGAHGQLRGFRTQFPQDLVIPE